MTLTTQDLEYTDHGTTLDGVVVIDEARNHWCPGVLLIHGGAALDGHARGQAHRYAELGYVVLACDYVRTRHCGQPGTRHGHAHEPARRPRSAGQRAAAGLAALSARADVNGRLAAVGFCFGGMAALTLARSGADLAAVVSMHGSLATTKRAGPATVTAKVLVCHGALDPHVPMADVVALTEGMTEAGADWQVNVYGCDARLHARPCRGRGDAGCRVPSRYRPPLVRGRTGFPLRSSRGALTRPGVSRPALRRGYCRLCSHISSADAGRRPLSFLQHRLSGA